MEISCRSLWVDWKKQYPNDNMVNEIEKRVAEYKKEDWPIMAEEINKVMENLSYLCKNKIPFSDSLAQNTLKDLHNHMKNWFLNPTSEWYHRLRHVLITDINYKKFFDQFEPGLSEYMIGLFGYYINSQKMIHPIITKKI